MSAVKALKAGTIAPAQSLGMDRDIGSFEVGKLADLLILSEDPSQDIRKSDTIEQVMLGGRLYDARTMHEVATGTARQRAYWWESGAASASGSAAARAAVDTHGHGDGDGPSY